jgi:hypothetical protein
MVSELLRCRSNTALNPQFLVWRRLSSSPEPLDKAADFASGTVFPVRRIPQHIRRVRDHFDCRCHTTQIGRLGHELART